MARPASSSIARKGRIAEGYDADFTIVDLKARRTITNDWIESRCGWTPYDGMTVQGWPVGTIVRGTRVDVGRQPRRRPGRRGDHVSRMPAQAE